MSALFTPKRADGKAEWRVVYDLALPLRPGETLAHDDIREALNVRPEEGMSRVYKAVGDAAKHLRRHNRRSLEAVVGVGYRVLQASEHELQARRFQRASNRKMRTSLEVVKATDLDQLSAAERQRNAALAMVLQGMCQAISSLDARQRRTEAALAKILTETDERLSEQEQQMARMAEAMREAGILRS